MAPRGILCAIVTAALLLPAGPAAAAPVESGHFHDVFIEPIPDLCGVEGQLDHDVKGNFTFNSSTGRYRDSVQGTFVWTNLETGRSFTEIFNTSSRDIEVTDNGDGTLTVLVQASGGYRSLDSNGKLFLRDPGMIRLRILVLEDGEVEVLDIVKESTGLDELEGRDFCEDFHLVTD